MKKLITLLLAVAGMVGTVSATDYVVAASDVNMIPGTSTWDVTDGTNLLTETSTSGIYTLVVENCSLTAGNEYKFKIAEKQSTTTWGKAYPTSDWVFKVGHTGNYTLIYFLNENADYYVSVIALPSLRSDLYSNWNALDPAEGKYFTPSGSFSWFYDIASDDFTNSSYYFRIFSAVGIRCQNDGENKLYSGKQIYPKTSEAELTYPETEESYFNDDNTGWSWKITKPSYSFEKIRITATYDTSDESWSVKADAYISKSITATNEYATFGTTVPVDLSVLPEDVTAYTVTANATSKAINRNAKSDALAANEGVLLHNETGKDVELSIPVAASATASASNDMVAFTETGNLTQPGGNVTYYILAKENETDGVGFYQVNSTSGNAMGANTAYLKVTGTGARSFLWFDEPTGIDAVEAAQMNGEAYNLAGQRVAQPTKGLYIVNGKKIVMK